MGRETVRDMSVQTDVLGVEDSTQDSIDEIGTFVVTFTLNIQDFSYPEMSADVLERLIIEHEKRGIPVEVFLTTTMVDEFSENNPGLWDHLQTSPVVDISYHIRPPVPYRETSADTVDWELMSEQEIYDLVYAYETHGLDLVTGLSTDQLGSFEKLTQLLGHPPTCVGAAAIQETVKMVQQVFSDLGAKCLVKNSTYTDVGEYRSGMWLRPQHGDLKFFEALDVPSETILQEAKETALASGGTAPYFLNLKMHDNNFFAENSAWTTVYLAPGARRDGSPYDTSLKSTLLSLEEQNKVFDAYVSMLDTVLQDNTLTVLNLSGISELYPQ